MLAWYLSSFISPESHFVPWLTSPCPRAGAAVGGGSPGAAPGAVLLQDVADFEHNFLIVTANKAVLLKDQTQYLQNL